MHQFKRRIKKRLAEFILANVEAILEEWEVFARRIWPETLKDASTDPAVLRDHAEEILRAAAADMVSGQTKAEQSSKSMGGEKLVLRAMG